MYKTKNLISLILVLAICFSFAMPIGATELTDANGTAQTPVVLNAEAATFSVTVPTGLPVNVAADGTISVATDAKIINNSAGPVKVVDMSISAVEDWIIAGYETDLRNALVDSNQIGMVINDCQTTGADAIVFDATKFIVMMATNDSADDECPIIYNAKVTPLSEAFSTNTVANVVFTIDWDKIVYIPVVSTNANGESLNATSELITGPEKTDLLNKLEESGLVDSANDVDELIEVNSDDFDGLAETTFDVSNIAQEGDKVIILHYDETKQEWEFIAEETVDANGKVTADFSSYSPVAFVVVKPDGSTEIVSLMCGIEEHYLGDGLNHNTIATCGKHTYACECSGWIIPSGVTYTTSNNVIYNAGEMLPCGYTVTRGDQYVTNEYQFVYDQYKDDSFGKWWSGFDNGWGFVALDKTQQYYSDIPDEIFGKPIKYASSAFNKCTEMLEAPYLPDTIVNMDMTFSDCRKMQAVDKIPADTTSMQATFSGCYVLESIPEIPSGVKKLTMAFQNCRAITTAPDLNHLSCGNQSQMFAYCYSLETAPALPTGGVNMMSLFMECNALTDISKVVIPETCTDMRQFFYGCSSLTDASNFVIPETITTMTSMFASCKSLTKAPVIHKNAKILDSMFSWCESLTSVTVNAEEPTSYNSFISNSGITDISNILGEASDELKAELFATK